MEQRFNKLVRDYMPKIIAKNGESSLIRILDYDEYKIELYKKLLEEAKEVISSEASEETLEELADVLEIIRSIAKLNGKDLDDIIEIANQKRIKKGGFEKRIFLESTYSKQR